MCNISYGHSTFDYRKVVFRYCDKSGLFSHSDYDDTYCYVSNLVNCRRHNAELWAG